MAIDPGTLLQLMLTNRQRQREGEAQAEQQRQNGIQQLLESIGPALDAGRLGPNDVRQMLSERNATPGEMDLVFARAKEGARARKVQEQGGAADALVSSGAVDPQLAANQRRLGPEQGIRRTATQRLPQGTAPGLDAGAGRGQVLDALRQAEAQGITRLANRFGTQVGEKQKLAAEGRERFVEDSAQVLSVAPGSADQLRRQAQEQFGPQEAGAIMAQIETQSVRNRVDRSLAAQGLGTDLPETERSRRLRINEIVDLEGVTQSMARDIEKGKAFPAPGLGDGLFVRGNATLQNKAILLDTLQDLIVDAERLAAGAGAISPTPFTGPLNDLTRLAGGEENPALAAYEVLQSEFNDLLLRARTGAVINDSEMKKFQNILPKLAQLRLKDGRLDPASANRFTAFGRSLETQQMSMFDASDRGRARDAIRRKRSRRKLEPLPDGLGGGGIAPGVSDPDMLRDGEKMAAEGKL